MLQTTVVDSASQNAGPLRPDNTILRSWNLMGANGNQPYYSNMLTVGDFNRDGITDIAAVYWTILGGGVNGQLQEGVATVLTTGAPFNAAANDWPMIYQNPATPRSAGTTSLLLQWPSPTRPRVRRSSARSR